MDPDRIDEIEDIIEKIPDRLGKQAFLVVVGFISLLIIFSFIISWPDSIRSESHIISENRKIELIASSAGVLFLNDLTSQQWVERGQYLAVIENEAELSDIIFIEKALDSIDLEKYGSSLLFKSNKRLRLGQVESSFSRFLKAINDYNYYVSKDYVSTRIKALELLKKQTNRLIQEKSIIKNLRVEKLKLAKNKYREDSILFLNSVIIETDLEKSKLAQINAIEQYELAELSLSETGSSLQQTISEINQLNIERENIIDETELELKASYRSLVVAISAWKEKFALIAPKPGRVEFLQFWKSGDFVYAGDKVLSIIPSESGYSANVYLPSLGSGKVKIGQNVNISLHNYPSQEYGKLEGVVKNISLTSSEDRYLVEVELTKQLTTTFNISLEYRDGLTGVANILTNNQTLAARVMSELVKRLSPQDEKTFNTESRDKL